MYYNVQECLYATSLQTEMMTTSSKLDYRTRSLNLTIIAHETNSEFTFYFNIQKYTTYIIHPTVYLVITFIFQYNTM